MQMHKLRIILSYIFLSVLPFTASGSPDRLRDDLLFLTDRSQEGRATGSAGAQSTVFYLLREFRNLGLRTTVQCFDCDGKAGRNVVAVTPGWYSDYIVVGAYYDGFGFLDGAFYPGADSNASGVAALLGLARSLASECSGSTGLIFVAFDGHNSGLSGSREFLGRFSEEYPFRMMINLDILGSSLVPPDSSRPDYVIALGGIPYMFALERANRGSGLDISYDYYGSEQFTELFYRRIGDQSWFLDAGVPSLMFTSGITLHTNKVGDTVDTLDLDLLSRRITLIREWLMSMI